MHCSRFYLVVTVLLCFLPLSALAQVTAPQPQATADEERRQETEVQSHRILGVIPQFSITNLQDAAPLTPKEKFRLFEKSSFDSAEFGIVGFQAGLGQASDEFPEFGQGVAGYAKRYGAAFTDQVSATFFSDFFYPTIFKEDPRYFRLGEGSLTHRIAYALEQEFVAHTDHGGRSFDFSNVFGALSAGALSNAYHPPSDRGFELTMSRAGIALGYGALGGLAGEFYPDAIRWVLGKIGRKHEQRLQK